MDEATFEALYEETGRKLWSYIYRISGNATLADELLQETYFRFLRAARREMDYAQMRSYLYRIATNLIHDHWRRERMEQKLEPNLDENITVTNEGLDLLSGLQKLKPQERELLWLAYVEGNKHSEIAELLGLKRGSVRVLLFRARKKLLSLIGENIEVES